jgi:hypothetical protein
MVQWKKPISVRSNGRIVTGCVTTENIPAIYIHRRVEVACGVIV